MTASLFAALVPPPEAVAGLAEAVARLRGTTPEVGWVAPAKWHVTLCFLGRSEPNDALLERLARVAHRHPAPSLRVAGAGRFGDRVLFAKLTGDLRALAAGVARAAGKSGYEVQERPFRAHLTIARGRRTRVDLRPLVNALADVEGPQWTAAELRLMRGVQPEYETVARWPFSGPGNGGHLVTG